MDIVFWFKIIIGIVIMFKVVQIFCDIFYNLKALKHIDSFRLQIFQKTKNLYTKEQIRNAINSRMKINIVEIIVVLAMGSVLIFI